MQLFYLNTHGFSLLSELKKNSKSSNNIQIADRVLSKMSSLDLDVIFFSEFDFNSPAGQHVTRALFSLGFFPVYPNQCNGVSEQYTSIVICFTKFPLTSCKSPNGWLKWNEIVINGYRIVGVHVPDSIHEPTRSKEFWNNINTHNKTHYKEPDKEPVIYFGDMNVFKEGTPGKKAMSELLRTSKDIWLELGNKNAAPCSYTRNNCVRIDYAIINTKLPSKTQMVNRQDFYQEELSDHSALLLKLD